MMRLCALCMAIGVASVYDANDVDEHVARIVGASAAAAAEAAFTELLAEAAPTFASSHWVAMLS